MASTGNQVYKTARWILIGVLAVAVLMMLRRPTPAASPLTAAAVQEKSTAFNAKLEGLKAAEEHGESGSEAAFTADEVNAFIVDSAVRAAREAEAPATEHPSQPITTDAGPPLSDDEIQAALDKAEVAFEGNEVVAQTSVSRYSRGIFVTVRGRLGAKDGYLEFMPTAFKVGSLSVPVSLVNDRLQEKLSEPENREKLKLPPFIADLHVENGELKIKEK